MRLVWTNLALRDYIENIEWLSSEWGEREVETFTETAQSTLSHIQKMSKMYPQSDYPGIRKAVIAKQISLLYRINPDYIVLIRFWNNYQNPETMPTS